MVRHTITFLVIPELFQRYMVVMRPQTGDTSVYCQECETWVARYEGDHVTTQSEQEFFEQIVSDHEDDFGTLVEFSDETVTFK